MEWKKCEQNTSKTLKAILDARVVLDEPRVMMSSNIIYKYSCSQCQSTYIGETQRHLISRICEHKGCCVVIKFFFIIINKLTFSDTTVIEGGRQRKHSWDLKSFILGDTLQLITPLPRTGMFSKIWRAILVEVAGPKAPHWILLQTSHLLEQSYIFTKLHPQEGMS